MPVHYSMDTQPLALTVVEMLTGMLPGDAREAAAAGELGDFLPPWDASLRTLVLGSLRPTCEECAPLAIWLRMLPWGHCVAKPRIAGPGAPLGLQPLQPCLPAPLTA